MTKMTYANAIDNAIAMFSQGGQVDPEDKATVEKLEALKEQLAKYMIPDRFVKLEEMPHTGTMKVDRVRLKSLMGSWPAGRRCEQK